MSSNKNIKEIKSAIVLELYDQPNTMVTIIEGDFIEVDYYGILPEDYQYVVGNFITLIQTRYENESDLILLKSNTGIIEIETDRIININFKN